MKNVLDRNNELGLVKEKISLKTQQQKLPKRNTQRKKKKKRTSVSYGDIIEWSNIRVVEEIMTEKNDEN